MFTKWQMLLLGLMVSQGACLNAMDKTTSSPRKSLSCSQEAKKVAILKSSSECKFEKNKKSRGCSGGYPADPYLAELLKKDPRIEFLPI